MPKITSNVFFLKEKRFDAENGINSGESRQKKTHFEVHITTNRPLEMKWRSEQWTSWQGDNIKTKRSREGDKKVSSIDWFVVPSSTIRACAHTSVCELRVSCIGNTLRCRFWHQVVFYTRNALDAVFGIRLFFKCCVRRVKYILGSVANSEEFLMLDGVKNMLEYATNPKWNMLNFFMPKSNPIFTSLCFCF